MKKPSKDASIAHMKAYHAWVKDQLKDWDPADDKGGPDVYVPRFDGVKAEGIDNTRSTEAEAVLKVKE